MNCKKCLELQRVTGDTNNRCVSHGMAILLRRLEKQQKINEKKLLKELRRLK